MKTLQRIMLAIAVIICSIGISVPASAKYSRASSDFTYEGVRVKVTDRRDKIGRSHSNSYGYTTFENTNDHTVNLYWRCYGVRKGSGELVLVDYGKFSLKAKKSRGEVYNYSGLNNDNYKDYSKYVVAIEVAGLEDAPTVGGGSTSFTTNGVKVTVFDRRDKIGRSHTDTYGYIEFYNSNSDKVTVKFQVYGVLSNGKRTKVDSGTVHVNPRSTYKEAYSYTSPEYYDHTDFKKYVCTAEVTKQEVAPVVVAPSSMNESSATQCYNRIKQHKSQGALDQQDYADAIAIMNYDFHIIKKELDAAEKLANQTDESAIDRVEQKMKSRLNRFEYLGNLLDTAEKGGKLNATNKANLQKLKRLCDTW